MLQGKNSMLRNQEGAARWICRISRFRTCLFTLKQKKEAITLFIHSFWGLWRRSEVRRWMYSQLAYLLDLGMLVEEFPSSLFIPSSIFFLIAFRMCTSETEMEEVREREFRWESGMWRCCWRRKERTWETESITFIKERKRESGTLKQFEAVPRRCITQSHEVTQHQSRERELGGGRERGREQRGEDRERCLTQDRRDPVY